MNTGGNTQIYRHHQSAYTRADRSFNCGSVQYFADVCSTDERDVKLQYVYGPTIDTERCIFYDYIVSIIKESNPNAFFEKVIANYTPLMYDKKTYDELDNELLMKQA